MYFSYCKFRSHGIFISFFDFLTEYDCIDPIPFGLENNLILDSQITSSSELDETARPRNARLNVEANDGENVGAWVASADDTAPWLKIDLKSNVTLRAIATQGRSDVDEWITTYEVSYSIDGLTFETYEESGKVKVNMCLVENVQNYFCIVLKMQRITKITRNFGHDCPHFFNKFTLWIIECGTVNVTIIYTCMQIYTCN